MPQTFVTADEHPASAWRFDHLGIVTADLAEGRRFFDGMLGSLDWTAPVDDDINGVRLQFGRDQAGMIFELLVPIGADSPVRAALKGQRDILNHIAYRVTSLAEGRAHLRELGSLPVTAEKPAIAYGGKPVQFFMTPLGMIVELIEAQPFAHLFESTLRPSPKMERA